MKGCVNIELNQVENQTDLIHYCPLYHDLFEKLHVPDLSLVRPEDGALIECLVDHVSCERGTGGEKKLVIDKILITVYLFMNESHKHANLVSLGYVMWC